MLGVNNSQRKFRKYLQAAPSIQFLSDHNPLVWLRRQKDLRGKFARWMYKLEILAYEIKYLKGAENGPADFLSRISTDIDWEVNDEDEHFERHIYQISYDPDWLNKMKRCQEEDALVSSAISQLRDTNQVTQGQFKNQVGKQSLYSKGNEARSNLACIVWATQVSTRRHALSEADSSGSEWILILMNISGDVSYVTRINPTATRKKNLSQLVFPRVLER